MKNIFRILGVVLVASCMILASCKKDDPENNNNNNNNNTPTNQDPNNGGNGGNTDPNPPVGGASTVTFNGSTWNVAELYCGYAGDDFVLMPLKSASSVDENNYMVINDASAQIYAGDAVGTYPECLAAYTLNDDDYVDMGGDLYPHYMGLSQLGSGVDVNITAINLEGLTISATATGSMSDLTDENYAAVDFAMTLNNASFEGVQFGKKGGKLAFRK